MAVQAAILLEAIFSKPDPTPGQIASINYIKYTNNLLSKVYDEYSKMPEQQGYNEEAWKNISSFEKRLNNYNKATTKQRLLVLKFLNSKDVPEFTVLQQWTKEIKSDYESKGLEYMVAEVDKLTKSNTENHLKNAEQSLNGARASALLFKVNFCYKNGNPSEAEKWTEQLAAIAPYEETKIAINSAFDEGNYTLASSLSPVFFAHWMRSMNNINELLKIAKKSDIQSITTAGKNISTDIAIVGKGVVALAKTGQYSNALSYTEQVTAKYESFMQTGNQKYMFATEYNPDAGSEKIYFNHAKAIILQQQGKNEEALQAIDSSIFYSNKNFLLSGYKFRIQETKVDMLIMQKQYDKALSECAAVERDFAAINRTQNYDAANFKLMKALIFYNMGKYQPALNTLTALKAINPEMPKCYLLEKEIYIALNDKEAAKQAEASIFKLYKKQ
jgi:tetratricopeptide (TPR) repeat protein